MEIVVWEAIDPNNKSQFLRGATRKEIADSLGINWQDLDCKKYMVTYEGGLDLLNKCLGPEKTMGDLFEDISISKRVVTIGIVPEFQSNDEDYPSYHHVNISDLSLVGLMNLSSQQGLSVDKRVGKDRVRATITSLLVERDGKILDATCGMTMEEIAVYRKNRRQTT